MHVRVVMKVLPPGMEHRQETNLSPEELGIAGRALKCLGRSPEKNVVNDLRILPGQFGHPWRHGEDHVEIRHGQ
jgi:hypothetical protein